MGVFERQIVRDNLRFGNRLEIWTPLDTSLYEISEITEHIRKHQN